MTVGVDLLDLPAGPAYQRMTFPHHRSLLGAPSPETVALAAHLEGEPAGLALAEIDSARVAARLHSLYVVETQRRNGIATSLIAELEEELRRRGCSKVEAVYATGGSSVAALERLIAQFGWAPPAPRSLIIKISQPEMEADERYQAMAELETPFSVCAWSEVTPEEREQIRQSQRDTGWIPPGLDPFSNEEGADLRTSVALRHGDEVVGWIINHELDPETSRATCAWVREDLQRTPSGARPLVALGREAGRRRLAVGQRYVIWAVNFTQPKMASFSERWYAPYAVSKQETRYTEKAL
jgi:GNAT superfamily N-acetyltransferase